MLHLLIVGQQLELAKLRRAKADPPADFAV